MFPEREDDDPVAPEALFGDRGVERQCDRCVCEG
jgi:hypothetical protein